MLVVLVTVVTVVLPGCSGSPGVVIGVDGDVDEGHSVVLVGSCVVGVVCVGFPVEEGFPVVVK
jgi:hypothetical protein